MRNLLRKPLPWMVLIECAVVAALIMVAWHVAAASPARAVIAPTSASPAAAGEATDPLSADVAVPSTPPSGVVLPGLNVDAGFWRMRLAELNRGETELEVLEWRLVHSAMDAARRYVESVVLPSVVRAQRTGR